MIEVYTKNMFGERIDLDSVFMREIAVKNDVKYCHADMSYEDKKYYVKNIPFCILEAWGTYGLEEHLIKVIVKYDIPQGLFDYEKFLMEDIL